jgi:hypothetical protein
LRRTDFSPAASEAEGDLGGAIHYTKRNPWGNLTADYGLRYRQDERDSPKGFSTTFREQRTFHDPDPVILDQPGMDLASIVVTKLDLSRVYRLGEDYTLATFGGRLEIHRVPTGHIADGETVWVEYRLAQSGSSETDATTQTFGFGQHFSFGLSLYYRGSREDRRSDPADALLDDRVRIHLLGARYGPGAFSLTAEYETQDSNTPYDTYRVNGGWSRRFAWGANAGLGAGWTKTLYRPPDERQIEYRTLSANLSQPLGQGLSFQGSALYRKSGDSVAGDDDGFETDLALTWKLRQVTCWLSYRFTRYEDDATRETSSAVRLRLVRDFCWPFTTADQRRRCGRGCAAAGGGRLRPSAWRAWRVAGRPGLCSGPRTPPSRGPRAPPSHGSASSDSCARLRTCVPGWRCPNACCASWSGPVSRTRCAAPATSSPRPAAVCGSRTRGDVAFTSWTWAGGPTRR